MDSVREGGAGAAEAAGSGPATSGGGARRRWRPWVVAAGAIAVLAYFVLSRSIAGQASAARGGRGGAPRAIPVVATAAAVGDLGVYQNGLGTVTAIKTVTVRSRVDGELTSVAFHEGDLVREGDLLAEIDPRPFEVQLHQAEAQLAKDQAAIANAKVDLERYQTLIQQDSIPRQQLDTQVATVTQYEAALKSDQAQIESARLNLTYSRITAPISGIAGLRLVDPGNIVHASDPGGLVVITQQQPIAVVFTIPGDHLPPVLKQVRAGRTLTVEAWDRDLKTKLATGSVLAVDNQIDPNTGTVRIKAVFPNEDAALYPNQFVNARLLVDTLRGAVLIPTAAIQRSPQSSFVYVVKPDATVELRDVEVELTEGDESAVRKGVAAGDVVVVDGVDKLQPGSLVAVAAPGGTRQRNT
ncbi:MAG TPA: MdtA/MuxA family multidrug efflux RND transporter periplasmic adaptor subunit [Thermoanaerobaculaceae bacterium]|nr:MdtA/MuxA family multidrug efflux RND transporter periplasmic adaptor subunit [Thermoanaerobaculaceae bacterium]